MVFEKLVKNRTVPVKIVLVADDQPATTLCLMSLKLLKN